MHIVAEPNPDLGSSPTLRTPCNNSRCYLPADGTGDFSLKMRATDAASTKGVKAGQQTRLVVIVMTDTADERIPRPATGYTCRTIILADVDAVDRRPRRVRHRRPNQRRPPGNQNPERASPTTTLVPSFIFFFLYGYFTIKIKSLFNKIK